MSATLDLTSALIEKPSLTPDDAGCQRLLADTLEPFGFDTEWFQFEDVSNLLITHGKTGNENGPSIWFLGHTDVVPPGPLEDWSSAPFEAEVRDGLLYGRGAADMKGAVAAMVVAAEVFVAEYPDHAGQIGILLTSDEEGPAVDGIKRVAETLAQRGGAPDYCLVGEPSSQLQLGDTVRVGRRGSIHAQLTVHGVQGHSAFPHLLDNPIHSLANFIEALNRVEWDAGDEDFPPSHCQVTNIHAGTGAENVTPGHAEVWINFRNSPVSPSAGIKSTIESLLGTCDISSYELNWRVSGEPFRSKAGELRSAVVEAIQNELRVQPQLNTGGGTSDGRFMAPLGTEVVELGLLNESIHKVDERTPTDDLAALSRVYLQIITRLLVTDR
ncbi:MAG: succinyl-diaminopimelate desuccinylase [Xanthomonadales bacterium]|nr:succinyl-diaminopimelate desuccinylase [Xanthomonadales bacterium]